MTQQMRSIYCSQFSSTYRIEVSHTENIIRLNISVYNVWFERTSAIRTLDVNVIITWNNFSRTCTFFLNTNQLFFSIFYISRFIKLVNLASTFYHAISCCFFFFQFYYILLHILCVKLPGIYII